jgi:hypothetical protein
MSTVKETTAADGEGRQRALVPVQGRGLVFRDLEGMFRFAQYVAKSGLAPKGISSPEAILVALQFGAELGLTPMASLQSIAVVNGRPAVYGDASLGVALASGRVREVREWYELKPGGERLDHLPANPPDSAAAVCSILLKGETEPHVSRFSVLDAKAAKLWGKQGPWTEYQGRMLRWRARGFGLRDTVPDVLKGLRTAEELQDYPAQRGDRTEEVRRRLGAPDAAVGPGPAEEEAVEERADPEALRRAQERLEVEEDLARQIQEADTGAGLDQLQALVGELAELLGPEAAQRALQAIGERRFFLNKP